MKKEKVLIVEDSESFSLYLHEGLKKIGYIDISACTNGKEAINKIRQVHPDLILMDISLDGEIDGIETAQLIGSLWDIPIIFTTGSKDIQTLERAKISDPCGYIIKPFDIHALEITIEMAFFKHSMEKKLKESEKDLQKTLEQLKSTQSQLLQQEKMASIGQLAAGVAHEINNPMGYIASNLGTLQKYTQKIQHNDQNCMHLINKLKDLAYPEVENLKQEIEKSRQQLKVDFIFEDISALIAESLEGADRVRKIVADLKSFSHQAEEETKDADLNKGLESTINIVWNELKYKAHLTKEFGDLPPVRCYPQKINQVVMNLLVNAAHAIENKGEIRLKTALEKDRILIEVSDTGCGIPEKNLSRIFEPFFTTKEVGKGTGLGLSMAYDIIHHKHGGEIKVDSRVGEGTTFRVYIPLAPKGESTST